MPTITLTRLVKPEPTMVSRLPAPEPEVGETDVRAKTEVKLVVIAVKSAYPLFGIWTTMSALFSASVFVSVQVIEVAVAV